MTAKDYLEQVKHMDVQIAFLEREIQRWRDMSVRVSGINYESHNNSNRNTEATYVKCLEKIDALEIKMKEKISELVTLKSEVLDTLYAACTPEQRTVLVLRYIDNYDTEKIKAEVFRSDSWIYMTQKAGLDALEAYLKK